jgi:hypothetical protein
LLPLPEQLESTYDVPDAPPPPAPTTQTIIPGMPNFEEGEQYDGTVNE